ncbi:hypothetical protein D3C71_1007510 [compost metagenome]
MPPLSSSTSLPSPCWTAPVMLPASICRRSLPAPNCTPPVPPLMVPRLTTLLSPAPLKAMPQPAAALIWPSLTTPLPPCRYSAYPCAEEMLPLAALLTVTTASALMPPAVPLPTVPLAAMLPWLLMVPPAVGAT